jgi:hypothetical protein
VSAAAIDIGSYRPATLQKHHSRTLVIVTDIARDNEALQAATRVNNPKCKGRQGDISAQTGRWK